MIIKSLLVAITALLISKTLWQLFALVRAWYHWRDERVVDALVVENPHNEFNKEDNVPF